MSEIINSVKQVATSIKNIAVQIKNRKYLAAVKEVFHLTKDIYGKTLKGRYIKVKGKNIPLTAVVVGLLFVYILVPSSENPLETNNTVYEENTYDKDGIKVYNLNKCENAVCGTVENLSENIVPHIIVSIEFQDEDGAGIYVGNADASDNKPRSRIKFSIPAEENFASFKLLNVKVEK